MNARPEIKDALLVQKMKRWLLRARYPVIGKGYPAWKSRKNYLSLVRTHRALAERNGLRETDLF
jgi:hypothetical protein